MLRPIPSSCLIVLLVASTMGLNIPIASAGNDLPEMPGFVVEEYASLSVPVFISFDPSTGVLYAGNGTNGTGVDFVYRVGVGGSPVEFYGDSAVSDPDTVLFDQLGTVSIAASVLIGGNCGGGVGCVWAIHPDQSVHLIFGPNTQFRNPTGMAFDSAGRFIFGNLNSGNVTVSESGEEPTVLFTLSPLGVSDLIVDDADRIITGTQQGSIHIHDADGTPIADPFVDGIGVTVQLVDALTAGPFAGPFLYTTDINGDLLAIDELGATTVVGSGFVGGALLAFGPDGSLYVSTQNLNRIFRISPLCPCPTDVDADDETGAPDLAILLGRWGNCSEDDPICICLDADDDGTIGALDLAILLGSWGPCE